MHRTRWLDWAHVVSPFRGQWLPGDTRGFRDHGARIRSHTAPDVQMVRAYAGLRRRAREIAGPPVTLTPGEMQTVADAILKKFWAMEIDVAALAAGATHCHALIRVFDADARLLFGRAKQLASHQVRAAHPGELWAASSGVFRMKSRDQFERTREYIAEHSLEGAAVYLAQ